MKTIAIAAVTAGGKTTAVELLKRQLPRAVSLHFDDYSFPGEVEDFHQWVLDGANYQVWDLTALEQDILTIRNSGSCDYLLLDYPFAYCQHQIAPYLDLAVFIDTPLDIALARRILRDMPDAGGNEIRAALKGYLDHARTAYSQMRKDILPSSDHVIDGSLPAEEVAAQIIHIIHSR